MKREQLKSSYLKSIESTNRDKQIYELHVFENLTCRKISEKIGLSKTTVINSIRRFETENPEIISAMTKKGKDITPEDYAKLKKEIMELKAQLSKESLRADFYEEMVKFGKEVYGIDLKKAGTK